MDCPRCEIIRDLPAPKYAEYGRIISSRLDLHNTIEELRDGLAASCWWCSNIAPFLLERTTDDSLDEIYSFRSEITRHENDYEIKVFHELHQDRLEYTNSIRLHFQTLSPAVKLERRTDSSESWQYIQHRLRECESLHKETCGSGELQNEPPTWLIKIEEQKDSRRKCRLVKSHSESLIGGYVTMSHRWQPERIDQKKLCTSNLGQYQDRIPMEELPKHYDDAVEVTWKLGFRYLWIDFLVSLNIPSLKYFILETILTESQCIVQDSEDLRHEIGNMTRIYHNAYCNLSAASADQGTEGLFFDRDRLRLPYIFTASDNSCQCVGLNDGLNDMRLLFGLLDSEPLYRRGWVFQERLLARRNISFTKGLIFIECHSSIDCEIGPVVRDLDSPFYPDGLRFAFSSETGYCALGKIERQHLVPFWRRIVGFYSQSELTYSDDRLTAISGLARYIANATKVDYLAGLWNESLPSQLLWRRMQRSTHMQSVPSKHDAKVDRAPTWSWANVDGPISFFTPQAGGYTPVVEIRETKCEGLYEPKSTGFVRLHGWVIPLCTQENLAMSSPSNTYWDYFSVDIGLTKKKLKIYWDEFSAQESTAARIAQELTKDCYALPLYLDSEALQGIVVKLTSSNAFRRFGIWKIESMEDSNRKRRFTQRPWRRPHLDEDFVPDAPYSLRVLLDFFGECDLPFLETVSGGRKLITLV